MFKDDPQFDARVHRELLTTLGERRYRAWFEGRTGFRRATAGAGSCGALEVVVGTPLERDCLQQQFLPELKQLGDRMGLDGRVVFRVDAKAGVPAGPHTPAGDTPPGPPPAAAPQRGAAATPAPPPAQHDSKQHDSKLASFVAGECNAAALAVAQQVAAGQPVASPLLLWGPTGAGKTHLLQAIRDEARRRNRKARVVSLTAEQFTTGFVEAVHGRGLPSFRNKHRGVDLLILDDLQFLAGKTKTLEEFQHTLDTLLAAGGQIVLAADRSPADLRALGADLASRIGGGVCVELRLPDYDTRRRILQRMQQADGLMLDAPVIDTVAATVAGGPRELAGVLNQLRVRSELLGEEIDADLAKRLAEQANQQTTPRLRLDDIQDAVCEVFGVDGGVLRGKQRTKAATEPRMVAMWLARKHTRAAWSEIGAYFGRRSHSTVISACRRIDSLIDRDAPVRGDGGDQALQDALRRIELRLRTA